MRSRAPTSLSALKLGGLAECVNGARRAGRTRIAKRPVRCEAAARRGPSVIWGPRSPQQQGETADPVDVEDVQLHPLATGSCISRPPNGVQGFIAVAALARR